MDRIRWKNACELLARLDPRQDWQGKVAVMRLWRYALTESGCAFLGFVVDLEHEAV